jgi:hypothetical protein
LAERQVIRSAEYRPNVMTVDLAPVANPAPLIVTSVPPAAEP